VPERDRPDLDPVDTGRMESGVGPDDVSDRVVESFAKINVFYQLYFCNMVRCPRCGFLLPDGETRCGNCGDDVSRVINRPQQENARRYALHAEEEDQELRQQKIGYVGFWKRSGAGLLDLGIGAILIFCAVVACEILHYRAFIPLAMILAGVFYFFVITPLLLSSGYRASAGKVVAGIVVTDINGRELSFSRALLRELGKYVSLLTAGLGFVLMGFKEKKQGLHDCLALTVVTPRSEAHLLTNCEPANTLSSNRRLLFGKIIIGGAILFSVLILCYFSFVLHEAITPDGLAAHSLLLAGDSVADTKYPAYALPLYDTALALQPDDTQILVKKVVVLQESGRVDEAQACLNKAMIANMDDTVPIIASGDLMFGNAQYQSAIGYYEKALGLNRNDADVWIRKGDAYLAVSVAEMQGMREQYKSLTSRNAGSHPSSDSSTMDTFRSTDSYREAIKSYNEAIRIDPMTSVEISGRVLASTQVLIGTYQGILDDIGIDNSTINQSTNRKPVQ
jgi:tetratricopeptide (TPR) repeat protein